MVLDLGSRQTVSGRQNVSIEKLETPPHTSFGYLPSLIEFVFDTTRAVTHLALSGTLERWPDLRLIVPHAGGTIPFLVDRISLLAARFRARHHCADRRGSLSQAAVLRACHLNEPARCCLGPAARRPGTPPVGSDWPALDEADVQSLIQVLGANPLLNQADRARIEWQNAMELFSATTVRLSNTLTVAPSATRQKSAPVRAG